jgi:hypothetical protein
VGREGERSVAQRESRLLRVSSGAMHRALCLIDCPLNEFRLVESGFSKLERDQLRAGLRHRPGGGGRRRRRR